MIPLSLYGTFSYFPTSKPSTKDLEEPDDVYVLTPTTWNPHSDAYVINEESMLDWEDHVKNARDHEKRVGLEEIPSDETMISSLALCEKEEKIISSILSMTKMTKMKTPALLKDLKMKCNCIKP